MSQKAKSDIIAVIAAIAGGAWTAILGLFVTFVYKIIPPVIFVGVIISYMIITVLILLHLYKPALFREWRKIFLYSIPIVIILLSFVINEIFKPPIPKFTDEEFGILVADFEGETDETKKQGKELKSKIKSDLKREFEAQKTEINVNIKSLDEAITPNTGEAKRWGAKYNANIVLYGNIIGSQGKKAQISPWLTIVDTIITKEMHRIDIFMGEYLFDWDEFRLSIAVVENPKTLYTLTEALIHQRNRKFDKAREKIESIIGIINLEDTLAIKHHFLGNLYLSQVIDTTLKDVKRDSLLLLAKQEYLNSIAKDPTYHNSYYGLGYLLAEMKQKPESAIPYFEKGRELQKDNYKYNWNLAQAYFQTKQFEKAKDIFSTYLSKKPKIEKNKRNDMEKLLKTIDEKIKVERFIS